MEHAQGPRRRTLRLAGFEQLCKAYESLHSPKDWESGSVSEPSSDWLSVMESRLAVWESKTKKTKTATPAPSNPTVAAKTAPIVGKSKSRFPDPAPGFISQVVEYNLATAKRRQPELALFGGIALQSTLASRKVRSGHKGRPNLLIVALSGTASGKQHAREVNSDILKLAGCEALLLGNDFTSDIALFRALESAGAGLSQIDEFGRVLAGASKPGTRQHEIVTSLMMLATSEGDASCKAKSYADASRSLSLCYPCLSIYATGTVEPFFESIGAGSVDDGFLGRLLVVRGRDQVPNSRSSTPIEIPTAILRTASEWYAEGGNLIGVNQGSAMPVERIIPADPIAKGLFTEFSEKADALAWKGMFQTLRRSCETHFVSLAHPSHAVSAWLGHSNQVSKDHYLMITSDAFAKATETKTEVSDRPKAKPSKSGAESGAVLARNERKQSESEADSGADVSPNLDPLNEKTQGNLGNSLVVRAGLEPATHGFSVRCSTN